MSTESGSSTLKRSQTTEDQRHKMDNDREREYESQAGILMEPFHCYIHPSKLDCSTKNSPSAVKVTSLHNKVYPYSMNSKI